MDDQVVSVRLPRETADEVRAEAKRTRTSVSAVMRKALQPVLERARAIWFDEHSDDPDLWEVVAVRTVSPRRLASMFSVRVEGDELWSVLEAAQRHDMSVSGFMRAAAMVYAAEDRVLPSRTFACAHLSLGGAVSASCGICGTMRAVA